MEHWAPHPSAKFEGYYSKFLLPSGASLAVIVCTVPKAPSRPHMVSFSYVPNDTDRIFQKELWVKDIQRLTLGADNAFELRIPGIGYVRCSSDSETEYYLEHEAFSFRAKTYNRIPWSHQKSTPEGLLVYLPLPLHWHVHSLHSDCDFRLDVRAEYDERDERGRAIVHQEKNWAHSFPDAHIWIQAREGSRGFCCAGGKVLGMEAFLLGYRSDDCNVDFQPPFALSALGFSPFMTHKVDWGSRRFELAVQSCRQKFVVRAQAPKGTFFSLSSPFPEGHRENFLGQSFQATLEIEVYAGGWTGPWRLVLADRFEGAALEFGGGYYPTAGTDKKRN